jgi:hypothetical protein
MNHMNLREFPPIVWIIQKQTNTMYFSQKSPVIKPKAAYGTQTPKKRYLVGYFGMP